MGFGAILGSVLPTLLGGLFKGKSDRSAQKDANAFNERQYRLSRRDGLLDRADDRAYLGKIRKADINLNRINRRLDMRDAVALRNNDRAYVEGNRAADQKRIDQLARGDAASRGIDFGKLRDQAVAAGFNPVSVLGMAGQYSTELNRSLAGRGAVGQYGGGGSNGFVNGGVATGPISGSGRSFQPALTTGSFVEEALARGVDTYFNTPPALDGGVHHLQQLRQSEDMAQKARATNFRQDFGYDLTRQAAFKPAVAVGVPPLARPGRDDASSPSDGGVNPSQKPIKVFGNDFEPSGENTDQETFESRYGGLAGELYGMGTLAYDLGHNAGNKAAPYYRRAKAYFNKYRRPRMYQPDPVYKPGGDSFAARYPN